MILRDELIYLIERHYSGAEHMVNFWVGQPVKNDGTPNGAAFLASWSMTAEQPDDDALNKLHDLYGAERQQHQSTKAMEAFVDQVKKECGRRIFEVIDLNAQNNLTARRAAQKLSPEQSAVFDQGLEWVAAMRTTCGELIARQEANYRDDALWPVPSENLKALAAAF